jgi:hypothetical protein
MKSSNFSKGQKLLKLLDTSYTIHEQTYTFQTTNKLCGLSPQANYTDWATAACRPS